MAFSTISLPAKVCPDNILLQDEGVSYDKASMRAMGIQGVSRRRAWCVTTERNKSQRPAPDLVKRVFVAQDINELWVADMTYVPTWEGFLYLAVVTDACSRKVVGWAFGVQMTSVEQTKSVNNL